MATCRLNLDPDLRERLAEELDPSGPVFCALPLREQLLRLAPYFRVQEARDQERLGSYIKRSVISRSVHSRARARAA